MISYAQYCTGYGSGGTYTTRFIRLVCGAGLVLCLSLFAGISNVHAAARCTIDTVPSPAVIDAGGNLTFTGKVTGKPPTTYQWTFSGGDPSSSNAETVSVNYASDGDFTATLVGRNDKGETCTENVNVTVNAVQQPVCHISVEPTSLDFGNVNVGASNTLTTTVTNTGTGNCGVTLGQNGSNDFSIDTNGFNLNPGSQQVVSVTYTPSSADPDNGTLTVSSDGPDSPIDVSLSGNGVVQNNPPECTIDTPATNLTITVGDSINYTSTVNDPDGDAVTISWTFEGGTPPISSAEDPGVVTYNSVGNYTTTLTASDGQAGCTPQTRSISVQPNQQVQCVPADLNTSINSTSQNGCPDGSIPQVAQVANDTVSILAINDLGMHCGDLDTRIASILPPFQAMLAQVIQKGADPVINPAGVELYYSATSNPNDPILDSNVFDGVMANGDTYKTNFWNTVAAGTYDPFYPAYNPFNPAQAVTPLVIDPDVGLPVPNVEHFYLGPDGIPNTGDESLSVVQHAMPGIANAYIANDRQLVQEHYTDKPFFINFPFGYVAENVNWYEGAGIPFAAFDDYGRENAYPLVRVEARQGNTTVSTIDTVLPISGEANCTNCHSTLDDFVSIRGDATLHRSTSPTDALADAGLPVAISSIDDPESNNLPPRVSLEYAADINVLRLHDLRHGANYVTPDGGVDAQGNGTVTADPCDITANAGDGDVSCLTNKALVQGKPVVCQVCHYTPALDLAHLGPLTGPVGTIANGRNQLHHKSNSYVMHSHHGSLPNNLFPPIPPIAKDANGTIANQDARLKAMEDSCYQCHPGRSVQCLRGPMFNGGMLCSDCHGDMQQVGNDFTQNVTVNNPGPDAWLLGGNYYDPNDPQPRVPWANEPGCGSCHTGDYGDNLTGLAGVRVNTVDTYGNDDGIRLMQAYANIANPDLGKATPIVPSNKRFAEPEVPATTAHGVANNGAGNPQLYRVSTGHGGVMCEGCHGATHAEWPNAKANSNDNITATQLQGHTGTIVECSTCHGTAMDSQNTLGGPHGMHPVGDSTSFARGGHERVNTSGCSDCHGPGSRGSNLGTVLSVAKADRNLRGTLVRAGEPVGCSICH